MAKTSELADLMVEPQWNLLQMRDVWAREIRKNNDHRIEGQEIMRGKHRTGR